LAFVVGEVELYFVPDEDNIVVEPGARPARTPPAEAYASPEVFAGGDILVTAAASTAMDSYCALAWGGKLAAASSAELSAGVLTGDDRLLDERERALARWARTVAVDANAIVPADVQPLRDAGYSNAQILAITMYVALRLGFSMVNDALGAAPDWQLRTSLPMQVLGAVGFGRPLAPEPRASREA
jgi:hypothetical protein